jgi:AAA15 family ATPase/GTPase
MTGQESTGTQQFFNLAAPILHTIANGMTLYIDEFGTYLHPDICQFIVKLFNSPELNKAGAQLIVNTHDASLMSKEAELLKREDIVIVEKNYMEETLITPLIEKSVREGESFEKRYRKDYTGEGRK